MNSLPVVSVTEVQMFRECRRKWHLSSLEHLVPKKPQVNMWFGDLIHKALETYWSKDQNLDAASATFTAAYLIQENQLKEAYGDLWEQMEEQIMLLLDLGQDMLQGYHRFCASTESGENWETEEVEVRYQLPIRSPLDGRTLKGTPTLSAKMDLVVTGELGEDKTVVDHKTMAQKFFQTAEALDLDEQMTGYAYVYWRRTGIIPSLVYDVLIKKAPHAPKVLKSGALSVDKKQATTYQLYTEKMVELGLRPSDGYDEMLEILEEKGWSDFFYREETHRNEHQLKQYEQRLYYTYKDMRTAALEPMRLAYAEPSAMKCRSCSYIGVCHAIEDGGDYQALIDNNFEVKPRDITGILINDTVEGIE